MASRGPLSREDFVALLEGEGRARYHHQHPFHVKMHQGTLTAIELRRWVGSRYYYQTRIPLKDAIILSKSEEPDFRRMWRRRIEDQDGAGGIPGGLALFQRLGEAVGIPRDELMAFRGVLPGVRDACNAYVELVRGSTLLEAVASSLTELFAPSLMAERLLAWERYYPWVDAQALEYFRVRVGRSQKDANDALGYVVEHATTLEEQTSCVTALVRKAHILWWLLDCIAEESAPLSAAELRA